MKRNTKPTPPRQPRTGPTKKRLDQLQSFGTSAQRTYYKRRVREDVATVLLDLREVQLAPEERAAASEAVRAYLDQIDHLIEHVPHLLNASCQTRKQWAKVQEIIPEEAGTVQPSLPL